MAQVSASILASNFLNLETELISIQTADRLHIDVMDGHFVPNISFGPAIIEAVQRGSSMPIDVHLMATNPHTHLQWLVDFDVQNITIHAEAADCLPTLAKHIRDAGIDPGVAINPETDVSVVESAFSHFSRVVVMGVDPGFAGQRFLPSVLHKIEFLADGGDIIVEVDGGIDEWWGAECIEAGADILVSGSTIFSSDDRPATIDSLRNLIE
jgi:ribulose-phosphate 3-epimerase